MPPFVPMSLADLSQVANDLKANKRTIAAGVLQKIDGFTDRFKYYRTVARVIEEVANLGLTVVDNCTDPSGSYRDQIKDLVANCVDDFACRTNQVANIFTSLSKDVRISGQLSAVTKAFEAMEKAANALP